MGSAIDNLLFNLKLQFLALPSLARLGLLTFAGMLVLREAIGVGWRLYQRRTARPASDARAEGTSGRDMALPAPAREAPAAAALPAPDPLAQSSLPVQQDVRIPMPGRVPRPGS
jgi:hypothetical protein